MIRSETLYCLILHSCHKWIYPRLVISACAGSDVILYRSLGSNLRWRHYAVMSSQVSAMKGGMWLCKVSSGTLAKLAMS